MPPSKHVAVVACMDARLDVYRILGLNEGEAHVIRNAGGVVTDDVIRSLAISQRLLGTREIILIHHTDCGMLTFTDDDFKRAIQEETGVKPPWATEAFPDLAEDVRQSLRRIENSPFVTKHVSVRGFVFDVATGKLEEVTVSADLVGGEGLGDQPALRVDDLGLAVDQRPAAPQHPAHPDHVGGPSRRHEVQRHRHRHAPQFRRRFRAAPRRRHHGQIGEGGDGAAMDHVADGDVGGIPRQPQPDFVLAELIGDDSQLRDERRLGEELRDDVAAALRFRCELPCVHAFAPARPPQKGCRRSWPNASIVWHPRHRLTPAGPAGSIYGNNHKYGQFYQVYREYNEEAMTSDVKAGPAAGQYELSHLRSLEAEAIHIIREVAAEFERPVLLFSGGKDSIVMLHLALKAFRPGRLPFPVMHVDTGHNFDEVIATRDELVAESGVRLVVASVQEDIDAGRVVETIPSRNPIQTVTLLRAIRENKFDAAFGGARRDEEKARAKERVFSFRDEFGQWDPKVQRPELWNLYNGRHHKGEHIRVFPLSNWTEFDIWSYIGAEKIKLPSIYFAHRRKVFRRDGMLLAVDRHMQPRADEPVFEATVRFRTVGDVTCTGCVESEAATVSEVIAETAVSRLTERGATRADDRISEAGMEDRKRQGYF